VEIYQSQGIALAAPLFLIGTPRFMKTGPACNNPIGKEGNLMKSVTDLLWTVEEERPADDKLDVDIFVNCGSGCCCACSAVYTIFCRK
jgi:hypothetical protein